MSYNVIGETQLMPGQWIQFALTEPDLYKLTPGQKAVYNETQRYLVITREDGFFDPCSCCIADISGKIDTYIGRMFCLLLTDFVPETDIRVVSRESVEAIHGVEKVKSVYQKAEKYIEELPDWKKDQIQILGGTSQNGSRRKFNEMLEEKAYQSNDNLPMILTLGIANQLHNDTSYNYENNNMEESKSKKTHKKLDQEEKKLPLNVASNRQHQKSINSQSPKPQNDKQPGPVKKTWYKTMASSIKNFFIGLFNWFK